MLSVKHLSVQFGAPFAKLPATPSVDPLSETAKNTVMPKNGARAWFLAIDANFDAASKPAVDDVSFSIAAGERFALVGESGSGKTVTALSLLRLLPQAHVHGEILFDGNNLATLNQTQLRRLRGKEIAMIFQEPMSALNPLFTIGQQVAESLMLHESLTRSQAKTQAIAWLARVGMSEAARRFDAYPHQLSGGQRQRAMIAMALACKPKLLLADEPTTALDVTLRAQIMHLIADLQREMNMAVCLITHDLNLVRQFAQRVGVMQHGRLIECAPTATLFAHPQQAYTRALLASKPTRLVGTETPVAQLTRESAVTVVTAHETVKNESEHESPTPAEIVRAHQVRITFPIKAQAGGHWLSRFRKHDFVAVDEVNFSLNRGSTLGIVGESGSGKTTLAMALLGLQKIASGQIQVFGHHLTKLNQAQFKPLRARMQAVFQDPFSALSPRMTINQIVGEGLRIHAPQLSSEACQAKVDAALQEVGLIEAHQNFIGQRYPHEFSGGQRQRIAIARALVLQPELLVLDEPTSALDVSIQKQVLELLARLQTKYGMAFVLISHDLEVIAALAHHVLVMHEGRVVEQGEATTLLQQPTHAYTQALLAASRGDAAQPSIAEPNTMTF